MPKFKPFRNPGDLNQLSPQRVTHDMSYLEVFRARHPCLYKLFGDIEQSRQLAAPAPLSTPLAGPLVDTWSATLTSKGRPLDLDAILSSLSGSRASHASGRRKMKPSASFRGSWKRRGLMSLGSLTRSGLRYRTRSGSRRKTLSDRARPCTRTVPVLGKDGYLFQCPAPDGQD